ncbi:adenine DNA glycosylase isoform X3 [Medicago truncatula]|uniref:adenine DNA glycosylase isoform X3 n=1 Tax=Medicago truncatula TaxID=3880 RepID=UPI000D2F2AB3|nr:adenine DNA glycosylase isoform X3 [Medicago truncatula]
MFLCFCLPSPTSTLSLISNINMSEKTLNKNKTRKRNINSVTKKTPTLVKTEDIEDSPSFFSKDETHKLRTVLLDWYDRNQRVLPWRTTLNDEHEEEEVEKRAYGVWVSEVMLQQTRVQTVIAYFNRWMLKWPTIHHLAKASLEEVNEIWAGLGYYRRARFLLEGAKQIVAEGGSIPKTASTLRKIPGIGDYTSGAIASIAFKEAVPVVDGNVIRVIARLRAISENPKDSVIIKRFWEIAAQLVDPLRPGDFNQALMELGATVCTPLNPSCSSCPASEFCHALSIAKDNSTAAVTDYPIKVVKVKPRSDFCAVCVVELLGGENQSSSRFVLVKRPDEGLLAGLWEFPSVLVDGETAPLARRKATDCFLKKSLKIDIRKTCDVVLREDVGEFVHIFSHIRLKLYVELLVLQLKGDLLKSKDDETTTWKCVESNALSNMGLTTSVRKVYDMVKKFKQKRLPSNLVPTKKRTRTTKKN